MHRDGVVVAALAFGGEVGAAHLLPALAAVAAAKHAQHLAAQPVGHQRVNRVGARGSHRQADAAGLVAGRQPAVQLLPCAIPAAPPDAGLRAAEFQPGQQKAFGMRRQRMTPVIAARGTVLAPPGLAAVRRTVQAGGVLFVERQPAQVQHRVRELQGQQYADAARQVVGVGGCQQLPVPAAIAADVEAGTRVAIRREVGFAGGAVNQIRIGGVESQRADVRAGPVRPAALPAPAAIGAAPDSARRRAGPQPLGIGGMRDQRSDPPGDVEWAGALPVRQLGIPGGWRAPPPEVFQFAGVGLVKRLAGALREPRAVALECREFVVDHLAPSLDEAGTAEVFDSTAETQRTQR